MSSDKQNLMVRRSWTRYVVPAAAIIILFGLAAMAVLSAFDIIAVPRQNLMDRLLPPWTTGRSGVFHPIGTDTLGRDLLVMLMRGALPALTISLAVVVFAAVLGVVLGTVAGYAGGVVSEALILLTNTQLSFPFVLLAITIVGIFQPSVPLIVFVLTLGGWVPFARVTHVETQQISQLEYVDAVRVMGGSGLRVLGRHILPNILPSVLVLSSFALGHAVLGESFLSFLGLGVPSPSPTWGRILADGRNFISTAWWLTFFPGVILFLMVLAANVLGEEVREWLDPKLRH